MLHVFVDLIVLLVVILLWRFAFVSCCFRLWFDWFISCLRFWEILLFYVLGSFGRCFMLVWFLGFELFAFVCSFAFGLWVL